MHDSLQLQTGLHIEGIPDKLAGLMSRWYEVYDAVCVAQDNVLRPEEIALSIMMNSRMSGNTGYAVWCHREAIEEWLARIPPTSDLTAADVPWEALQGVFDIFGHIPRAKVGIATKILHKKRPRLLPMLDTRVAGYYHAKLSSSASTLGGYAVNLLKLFRGDLLAALPELHVPCEEAERQGRPVTPVRMLDHLIWSQIAEQEKG